MVLWVLVFISFSLLGSTSSDNFLFRSCLGVWVPACFSPPHWINNLITHQILGTKLFLWSLKVTAPSSSTGVADEKNDVNHLTLLLAMCVWVHLAFLLIHSTPKLHEIISTDYSLFIMLGTWDLSNRNLFLPCWEIFFNYLLPPLHFHSSPFLKLLLCKHLPIWIDLWCIFSSYPLVNLLSILQDLLNFIV